MIKNTVTPKLHSNSYMTNYEIQAQNFLKFQKIWRIASLNLVVAPNRELLANGVFLQLHKLV
jgi:hypothetical protein